MEAIDGDEGNAGAQRDWFFFVNGIEADRSAAEVRVRPGDIVWWDMLFGTYENPRDFKYTCGFDDRKEQRLFDMLAYQDVHR